MFFKELRQKFAQTLRPTYLVQGGGRIATGSDFSQKLLRPRSRFVGSQDAVHADRNPARSALPASEPILHEIDLATRGRHFEAEALQVFIPEISILFPGLNRVD